MTAAATPPQGMNVPFAPSGCKVWRARRTTQSETGVNVPGDYLTTEVDGVLVNEWGVAEAMSQTVLSRWGEGRYVFEFYDRSDAGQLIMLTRSRPTQIQADGTVLTVVSKKDLRTAQMLGSVGHSDANSRAVPGVGAGAVPGALPGAMPQTVPGAIPGARSVFVAPISSPPPSPPPPLPVADVFLGEAERLPEGPFRTQVLTWGLLDARQDRVRANEQREAEAREQRRQAEEERRAAQMAALHQQQLEWLMAQHRATIAMMRERDRSRDEGSIAPASIRQIIREELEAADDGDDVGPSAPANGAPNPIATAIEQLTALLKTVGQPIVESWVRGKLTGGSGNGGGNAGGGSPA